MSPVVIIIDILLILIAAVLIVVVLMQEGQSQGLGAIGGGAETFFGKNKAKSLEGKLATITKIAAIVFIVLAIVTTIIVSHQSNDSTTVLPSVEETQDALDADATPDASEDNVDGADATADPTETEEPDSTDAAASEEPSETAEAK
ncbi:MAG: preprotein translocase subunit SecG [Eubacteriales bacterium]|nr:preprotein translocase subunit SecG [Eubacteriales bacterium]